MKSIIVALHSDAEVENIAFAICEVLCTMDDLDFSIEVEDSDEIDEFNRLMTDIENEEAGIAWQVNP